VRHAWRFVFVAACLVSACARPTVEQQIVNDAAAALGGRDRILAVKTLVVEGDGANGNLGQDLTPERTVQRFVVSGFKRAVDLSGRRTRTEQTRTPNFTYFQGQAPQRQVFGLDGNIAYNIAPNGTGARAADAVAKDRRAEFHHHPLVLVRAALDPSATLANPRTTDTQRVVDVTTAAGQTFTLAIDTGTRLPTRIVSMADNLNLGDVAMETAFSDYRDVSGLKLPARLTTTIDRVMATDLHLTSQAVDGDAGDLAAPPAAAAAPATSAPPPATVTVQQLAKGVWFLAGQSHHSVLVEFADHLALIEALHQATPGRDRSVRQAARGDRSRQTADDGGRDASSLRPLGRRACGNIRRTRGHRTQVFGVVLQQRNLARSCDRAGRLVENPQAAHDASRGRRARTERRGDDGQPLSRRRQRARGHDAHRVSAEGAHPD
jgi:hypothetical protein